MTKKDFELIASVINDMFLGHIDWVRNLSQVANKFSNTLASKNPRFQKDKFLKACGVEIEKRKDNWFCRGCDYKTEWNNYKDGNPVCPNCDYDLEME